MASTVRKRRPSPIVHTLPSSPCPSNQRPLSACPGESDLGFHTHRTGDAVGHGGREETFPLMPILSPADNLWQITLPGPSV